LYNGKTDNDRQIINKQHATAQINQHTNRHNKQKTTQIVVVCVPIYIQIIKDVKSATPARPTTVTFPAYAGAKLILLVDRGMRA